jgi:hypothetical protein
LPGVVIALGAFALTGIFWPVNAIVRRRFGAKLALDPRSMLAYRWSKIASLAIFAGLLIWAISLTNMLKDISNLSSSYDGVIRFAQLFGIVAFIGGFVLLLWNLKIVWRGQRRWPAKLWSIILAASAFIVLWIGFVFHLIGFGLNY